MALNVRIEKLDPMRVASVCVISDHPEIEAWEKLRGWAEPLGLLDDIKWRKAQELESPLNPFADASEMAFELYLPIE